jgi:PAS domain S-box-containing protein
MPEESCWKGNYCEALTGEHGNISGVFCLGRDITYRKAAEGERNRVAQDLRLLIDTANAPIFGIDKQGRVNEWNRKAAEIVGYTSDEVMGRDLVEDFITPEYKISVKEVLDNALKGLSTSSFEFPLFSKSGIRVELLLNANPRRNSMREIVGVVGVGTDMTEKREAIMREVDFIKAKVGRCRLTASKPELSARLMSALETKI